MHCKILGEHAWESMHEIVYEVWPFALHVSLPFSTSHSFSRHITALEVLSHFCQAGLVFLGGNCSASSYSETLFEHVLFSGRFGGGGWGPNVEREAERCSRRER